MTYEGTIERLRESYDVVRKKDYFSAWGIVMNTKLFEELKQECTSCLANTCPSDEYAKVFGLVIIGFDTVPYDTTYIVDENLGKALLRLQQSRDAILHGRW